MSGLFWLDSDSFTIGWFLVLVIFGVAMLQFGKNALYVGHSEGSKPLIGPPIYYIIGILILIPGIWSYIEGSSQALMVAAIGAASIGYGFKLTLKRKQHKVSTPNEETIS